MAEVQESKEKEGDNADAAEGGEGVVVSVTEERT
jgi:hypothetical protein